MLAYGRLGQGQNLDDLTANEALDGFEVGDNLDPGRMTQCLADPGQSVDVQQCFIIGFHCQSMGVGENHPVD